MIKAQPKSTVIVVGAGLSGLSAAQLIVRSSPDTTVIVLESMDRVGGRTYSKSILGAKFDLGGMWIGPHQSRVIALAQRAQQPVMRQPHAGLKIYESRGKVTRYGADLPDSVNILGWLQMWYYIRKINRMARTIPVDCPSKCPEAVYYDSITLHNWLHQNIWFESVRRMFETGARALFGAETNEISMLFFLWIVNQAGEFERLLKIQKGCQESKFIHGSQSLSLFLQRQIIRQGGSVRLNAPVDKITRTQNWKYHVQLRDAEQTSLQCDHIIIAIPPVSVQKIHFVPKLSAEREAICQKNFMGSMIKVLCFYKTRFWLESGLSGEVLSDCFDGPILSVFDDSRPRQGHQNQLQPALLIFVSGAVARHWLARTDFIQRIKQQLKRYFGSTTPQPVQIHIQNWIQNPHTNGAPIGLFGPGLLSQVGKLYKKEGNIHWAGTEMATESQGYMDGAIQSGIRAAYQVLSQFRKKQNQVMRSSATPPVSWYYRLLDTRSWYNYFCG